MNTRRSGQLGLASSPRAGRAPTLPPWKAFVVQLSRETAAGSAVFAGRVEHLSSGRRARFDSKQELVAILDRMLGEIEDQAT